MGDNDDLKEKLKEKLKEIFQFENQDLNFGVYRIINYKRKEIEKFIEDELIKEVERQLEILKTEEINKEKIEFEKLKKKIIDLFGQDSINNDNLKEEFVNTPLGKEYYEKKRNLEKIRLSEELEKQVYNYLINFFSRYYDKGDFVTKRRYGKNEKYILPYNGEEIYFYWTNKDQYYIKTFDYFQKYSFDIENIKINILLVNVDKTNPSEKKFFVLNDKIFDFDKEKNQINIYLEYRTLKDNEDYKSQEEINKHISKILGEKISNIIKIEDKIIEEHLNKYTKRNNSDYFIHKDLKTFLKRELDFYIKNEILDLDNLEVLDKEEYIENLRKYIIIIRVFKNIASKIIEFLSQIENFQKKLWEKKKFVINTEYVITLDKVEKYAGKEFLENILPKILENEKQKEEWKELFDIEIKDYNDLKNIEEWKKLPIDTKYFDEDFKWMFLVSLTKENDLDNILDGILIKSENWQALNLLMNKYYKKIKTIYIDPPYNTGNDNFLYKDNYRHSSWLTMIDNRLDISYNLLTDDGVIFISIDDNELNNLYQICAKKYAGFISNIVWRTKTGSHDAQFITNEHEYVLNFYKSVPPKYKFFNIDSKQKLEHDEKGDFVMNVIWRKGLRYSKSLDFPLYVDENMKIYLDKPDIKVREVYPGGFDKSIGISWSMGKDTIDWAIKNNLLIAKENKGKILIYRKEYKTNIYVSYEDKKILPIEHKQGTPLRSIIYNLENDIDLEDMFKEINGEPAFEIKKKIRPKPVSLIYKLIYTSTDKNSIILDFFAGSGTTAHAVMKLNKEDNGNRKFILIEMADYFDKIIIPRIKKLSYSFNWKEGKALDKDGYGIFFKYQTLEQYEDTLENIEFEEKSNLYDLPDYFIKYMLEWETKNSNAFLNIEKIKDPFNYKLKIIEEYKQKEINVDLIETFNYLLGVDIKYYKYFNDNNRKYIFIFGYKDNKKIVIVWRNFDNIDLEKDKQIIENIIKDYNPDEIYINIDGLVKGFKPIEPLFKYILFEDLK